MGREIERKFLVAGDGWRNAALNSSAFRQGYLAASDSASVRVRAIGEGEAVITIKSTGPGLERAEFEYPIPPGDARELLGLCSHVVEKRRHFVPHKGNRWEVDVFEGPLTGLVLAELELAAPDQAFERPDWLGREVTGDPRYQNAVLARDGLPSI